MKEINEVLPHHKVFVRLAPSPIHGIGVFAICDIRSNTLICWGDPGDMIWIPKSQISHLSGETRRLYDDFCVSKGNMLGCPRNFNRLTPAWYLNNNSENPNVHCDEKYDFFTLRDIKKGEELTIDYSTYND